MHFATWAPVSDSVSVFALMDDTIAMRGAVAIAAEMLGPEYFSILPTFEGLMTSLNATADSCPNVVIANPLYLRLNHPLEEIEWLCKSQRVLAFCPPLNTADLICLIELGVHGFIDWSSTPRSLGSAVDIVAKGGLYISQGLPAVTTSAGKGSNVTRPQINIQGLTSRELEVLRPLACGMTHKEIARQLDLSKATIDTYVQRIRRKLDVGNKAQLTQAAYALGLIHRQDADPNGSLATPGGYR
jgi:DNA-binding NarL/FixJ family response regulator